MISYSKYSQRIKNYSTSPQKKPEILSSFTTASKKLTLQPKPGSNHSTLNPSPDPNLPKTKKTKKNFSSSVQYRKSLLTPEDESILNELRITPPKAPILNSPNGFTDTRTLTRTRTPIDMSIYLRTEELRVSLLSWKERRKKLEYRYSLLYQEIQKSQKYQQKVLEDLRLKLNSQDAFQS